MEPNEWKLLLDFFRHLRRKAYEYRFGRGQTVTMAMRRHERPLTEHLDKLIHIAETELRLSENNIKLRREAWLFAVSILRKERDFFDEFKSDKKLKQTLQKFLKRGHYENEI